MPDKTKTPKIGRFWIRLDDIISVRLCIPESGEPHTSVPFRPHTLVRYRNQGIDVFEDDDQQEVINFYDALTQKLSSDCERQYD